MAVDQVRPSAAEAQRMTSFGNVMMFKRADFDATIANAGEAVKQQASGHKEIGEGAERCVLDLGDTIEVKT